MSDYTVNVVGGQHISVSLAALPLTIFSQHQGRVQRANSGAYSICSLFGTVAQVRGVEKVPQALTSYIASVTNASPTVLASSLGSVVEPTNESNHSLTPHGQHHDWSVQVILNSSGTQTGENFVGWVTDCFDYSLLKELVDWTLRESKTAKFVPRPGLNSPIVVLVDFSQGPDAYLKAFMVPDLTGLSYLLPIDIVVADLALTHGYCHKGIAKAVVGNYLSTVRQPIWDASVKGEPSTVTTNDDAADTTAGSAQVTLYDPSDNELQALIASVSHKLKDLISTGAINNISNLQHPVNGDLVRTLNSLAHLSYARNNNEIRKMLAVTDYLVQLATTQADLATSAVSAPVVTPAIAL